jgi:hypothetical protein
VSVLRHDLLADDQPPVQVAMSRAVGKVRPLSRKSGITWLLHTPLTQWRDVARATGPAR